MPSAADIHASVAAAGQQVEQTALLVAAAKGAVADADADDVEATVAAEQRLINELSHELDELGTDIASLDGAVRQTLRGDPHKMLQDADAAADAAIAAHAAVSRRAQAARQLQAVVDDVISRTRSELAQPVTASIAPYLKRVFPTASVDMDPESWSIAGLVGEPLERLSVGAREQFTLLVRLGLAEVIAGGKRLPLVLDDPLINADADRRSAMIGAIRQAARHLQVIICTCHEDEHLALYPERRIVLPGRHRD